MKNFKFILVALVLMSAMAADSLFSVVTKKEDALVNHNFTKFILVDEVSNYCLAKSPVIYDPSKLMPVNYFTADLPTSAVGAERLFVVHHLASNEGPDEYDWVLEDNADEKKMFFSRSKFIVNQLSMQWRFVIRGERILLRNARTGNFLKINLNGSFQSASSESDASKWKLIHVF